MDCDHWPWVFWGNDKNWWIAGNYTIVTLVLICYFTLYRNLCKPAKYRNQDKPIEYFTDVFVVHGSKTTTCNKTNDETTPKKKRNSSKNTKVVASKTPLPTNFSLLFLFFVCFARCRDERSPVTFFRRGTLL